MDARAPHITWWSPPNGLTGFPAALILTDQDGTIRWANDFALELTGQTAAQLVGEDIAVILSPSAQLLFESQAWPLLAATGQVREIMLDIRRPDGGDSPVIASLRMEKASGESRCAIAMIRADDRRRHETLSRQARSMAEDMAKNRAEYFASLSHELRTPLNAILGFADMIASAVAGPLGNSKYQDWARGILAGGTHLLDVINEILDYAKAEQGMITLHLENVALGPFLKELRQLAAPLAEKKGVGLAFPGPDRLPVGAITADPYRLRQVLLNLISNAVRHSPEGADVTLGLSAGEDQVTITVADRGPGIPPEELERIFDPYVQAGGRRHDGTGLGLPLARRLAQSHGGGLILKSDLGQGTTAILTLPL